MRHPGGDPLTCRRRFLASSRYLRTPPRLLLELSADAADYVSVADSGADDFTAQWHILAMVLEDAPQKLTRRDILLEWPEDFDKPDPSTLNRWLNRALERKLILREGTGRKMDPYRFWLPTQVAVWREKQLLYEVIQEQTETLKLPFRPLHPRECDKRADDGVLWDDDLKAPFRLVPYAERDED